MRRGAMRPIPVVFLMVLMLPGIESGMRSGVMLLTPRQEVDDVTSSGVGKTHGMSAWVVSMTTILCGAAANRSTAGRLI